MLTIQQLKDLARHAARGTAPANFECENVNAALADGEGNHAQILHQNGFTDVDIAVHIHIHRRVVRMEGVAAVGGGDVRHIQFIQEECLL